MIRMYFLLFAVLSIVTATLLIISQNLKNAPVTGTKLNFTFLSMTSFGSMQNSRPGCKTAAVQPIVSFNIYIRLKKSPWKSH